MGCGAELHNGRQKNQIMKKEKASLYVLPEYAEIADASGLEFSLFQ